MKDATGEDRFVKLLTELGFDHRRRPLVHLLTPEGKAAGQFRHTVIAVPDLADDDSSEANQVYAVLVNGKGEALRQEDGSLAVLQAVPFVLTSAHDPDMLCDEKQVVEWTGLSASTIDRQIAEGTFPGPIFPSPRRKAWRFGDLKKWVDQQPRTLRERLYGLKGWVKKA